MPKTTFNVRKKRWDLFNRECKAASLRRDDLLDRILPAELDLIAKLPPSDAAGQKWLKANWTLVWSASDSELTPVGITLEEDRIARLNEISETKHYPRDVVFDCVLEYLVQRLYEAVIVIKAPRSTRDLVHIVNASLEQAKKEDVDPRELDRWLAEDVRGWAAGRNLEPLDEDFYAKRLHFTSTRVEEIIATEALLLELGDGNEK